MIEVFKEDTAKGDGRYRYMSPHIHIAKSDNGVYDVLTANDPLTKRVIHNGTKA